MSTADILLTPLLLAVTLIMTVTLAGRLGLSNRLALTIFIWHTSFCLAYWKFAQNNSADAQAYFQVAVAGAPEWAPGTRFVESFTGLFAYWLGFGEMLVFIAVLFIALIYLWRVGALEWGTPSPSVHTARKERQDALVAH